jgi:hypothetical protein
MSSNKELLNRLLSGDFSPEEIADDPILVSLAERVYGIKIDPVLTSKPRDFVPHTGTTDVTEVAPPTDMLIEVIGDIAPALPIGGVELPELAQPIAVEKKKIRHCAKNGIRRVWFCDTQFVWNLVLCGWKFLSKRRFVPSRRIHPA